MAKPHGGHRAALPTAEGPAPHKVWLLCTHRWIKTCCFFQPSAACLAAKTLLLLEHSLPYRAVPSTPETPGSSEPKLHLRHRHESRQELCQAWAQTQHALTPERHQCKESTSRRAIPRQASPLEAVGRGGRTGGTGLSLSPHLGQLHVQPPVPDTRCCRWSLHERGQSELKSPEAVCKIKATERNKE